MDNKEEIIKDLLGKSTVKRRKAAIVVRGIGLDSLNIHLYEALKMELASSNNWQTQVEIINTIGISRCYEAKGIIEKLVFNCGREFDLVKHKASLAWVRLSRKSLSDADPVITVLKNSSYSANEGALEALGYDKMIPREEEQKIIIGLCWDFGKGRPKGYTDPRYGLAAACAGWPVDITKEFLEHCLESNDSPINYVALNALKQKYVKLR